MLISHLSEPLFPRNIMTYQMVCSRLGQTRVDSKEEMLEKFRESFAVDCRINAFPIQPKPRYFKPDLIFIDLDLSSFKSKEALDEALAATLNKITTKFGKDTVPTVEWTGHGYHILLPIESIEVKEFERIVQFTQFDNVGEQFLKFASSYLSNNKSDRCHNPTSGSSLLRIPYSRNSKCIKEKIDPQVKIIQKWNGFRPHIKLLLGNFHAYLFDRKNEEKRKEQKVFNGTRNGSGTSYRWIESLLTTPISDFRKNAVGLILAPYLINIRKISVEEAHQIIMRWLNECNSLRKLDINANRKVRADLQYAFKSGYKPLKFDNLRIRNPELYQIVNNKILKV